MPLERAEALERFGLAATDLWNVAREMPDPGPEQRKAIRAIEAGKAIPRVIAQLGATLQVRVDALFEYGESRIVKLLYVEVPPESAAN